MSIFDIIFLVVLIAIGLAPVIWEIKAWLFRRKEKKNKK